MQDGRVSPDESVRECVQYFKNQSGFRRVFDEMIRKVRSYGRVGGVVSLSGLSAEERRALEGFFGEPVDTSVKFSLKKFEHALERTRFSEVSLFDLLEEYSGSPLVTNREVREKEMEAREKERAELDEVVDSVLKRLSMEASGHIRLAVLAMECLGDPHGLDAGTRVGNRLVERLAVMRDNNKQVRSKTAEERLEILISAGIRPDDISSFVCAFGIDLYDETGVHPGFHAMVERGEYYLISLSNMNSIIRAVPCSMRVYVIENQMVFSELCERCPGASVICSSGQPSVATLFLIDLLCREECEIYYSGDTDPEGLVIADRMLKRGNGKIKPWFMKAKDHEESISTVEITDSRRLRLMDAVLDSALVETCEAVRKTGLAGYQEKLIDKMVAEIHRADG